MQYPKVHTSMTSPKLLNTTSGSYDDDDFSPPPFYGSPLTTAYMKDRLCATISVPPKYIAGSKEMAPDMPRIRKAPACEKLTLDDVWPSSGATPVPRTIADEDNDSLDDDDSDTLYFVPGLNGVYSPNEWAKLANDASTQQPIYESRFVRRAILLQDTRINSSPAKDSGNTSINDNSICGSEFGWIDFDQGSAIDGTNDSWLRDKP